MFGRGEKWNKRKAEEKSGIKERLKRKVEGDWKIGCFSMRKSGEREKIGGA